jgi:hypothetical protein
MRNDTVDLFPPTLAEIMEQKDKALKALAKYRETKEAQRLANAEFKATLKSYEIEIQAAMDWLKSKGFFISDKDSAEIGILFKHTDPDDPRNRADVGF